MSDSYTQWLAEMAAIGPAVEVTVWPSTLVTATSGYAADSGSSPQTGAPAVRLTPNMFYALAGNLTPSGLFQWPAYPNYSAGQSGNGVGLAPSGAYYYVAASAFGAAAANINANAAADSDAADNAASGPDPDRDCGGIIGELGLCQLGGEIQSALKWGAIAVGGFIVFDLVLKDVL
jgi:hypothetical protein